MTKFVRVEKTKSEQKIQVGEEISNDDMTKLYRQKRAVERQHQKLNDEYELIPVLKEFKIKSLNSIIAEAVERKYKISFYKGI